MRNTEVIVQDWHLIDYKEAWDRQEQLNKEIVAIKQQNRANATQLVTPNYLVFCQHPHVYTLGKSGSQDNLLLTESQLDENHARFYKINRGGDITYHGPGQLVCYPIIDLENFFTDIHRYLRLLEEAVINTLLQYNITAGRLQGYTGVWLDADKPAARKICAMGVRCSRWVTMHGLALNVNANLSYFNNIVPCGIADKAVTSIDKEVGHAVDIAEVQQLLQKELVQLFGFQLIAG